MNKQSVKLRRRTLPSGNISLYLDIYHGGVRTYEYLKLYLVKGGGRKEKEQNRQTMALAEAICAQRLVEVRNGQYGFKQHEAVNLLEYVQSIIDTKKGSTRRRYDALNNILHDYCRPSMTLDDVSPAWFTAFLSKLEKQRYARNTMAVYVATFRYIINQACREGLLPSNPIAGVKGIGYEETNRVYLTLDEVRKLVETPCVNDVTKRAFLFGCAIAISGR